MMRTVYRIGRIYAGDGKFVKTFAVEDGKFCFAGEELPVQPEDRVVDLAGKFVCPGSFSPQSRTRYPGRR